MWLAVGAILALVALLVVAWVFGGDKRWEAVAAVSTFAAVLVALFGDWFKGRLWQPAIDFGLRNNVGELTSIVVKAPDGSERTAPARYYHLTVRNLKRWPVATQVQVVLIRIEEPRADGKLATTWAGEVPMEWRHQSIYPLARTVGPDADCDLLYVSDKWLTVLPVVVPRNFPLYDRRGALPLAVLTMQVRAAECDSPVRRFKISWDGKWVDGEAEMANHLVVEEVS